MSITDKLQTIAENEQRVYNAGILNGREKEYNSFWDMYQLNGSRTIYRYAFSEWDDTQYKPKYKVQPTYAEHMFRKSSLIGTIYTDELDFSKCRNMCGCFAESKKLHYLKIIDARNTTVKNGGSDGMYRIFHNCYNLASIDMFYPSKEFNFDDTFTNCTNLREIRFGSEISVNGLDLSTSTLLSKASIESIINSLSSTKSGLTVKFSKIAVQNAFGITDITNSSTWTNEYKTLRNSRRNWVIAYA